MVLALSVAGLFKWRQFELEVFLLAIGWHLRFSLSYRNVEELLAERGLSVDHVTLEMGSAVCSGTEAALARAPQADEGLVVG